MVIGRTPNPANPIACSKLHYSAFTQIDLAFDVTCLFPHKFGLKTDNTVCTVFLFVASIARSLFQVYALPRPPCASAVIDALTSSLQPIRTSMNNARQKYALPRPFQLGSLLLFSSICFHKGKGTVIQGCGATFLAS